MRYIEGTPREQIVLFPESLEEYISDDNPVRFIDAFVESLDLQAAGFDRTTGLSSARVIEAVYLRLSEPDSQQP